MKTMTQYGGGGSMEIALTFIVAFICGIGLYSSIVDSRAVKRSYEYRDRLETYMDKYDALQYHVAELNKFIDTLQEDIKKKDNERIKLEPERTKDNPKVYNSAFEFIDDYINTGKGAEHIEQ